MRFLPTALGAVLLLKAAAALPSDPYSIFTSPRNSWDADTTIFFPNSTQFVDATERWNSYNQPSYSFAITPATEEDVAQAVTIARSINFPFLATGGRHSSSTTLGNLRHGLAIDLSALNTVNVDAEAGTLTIGGGTPFGDILDPVYEAGYQMPVGSCVCPGMVGATVGGGVGRLQGVNGLIIDSLLSVRLVTAEGRLIDVSEVSHPDLFWAIRGAAPNFGIITSATYQLHPQNNGGQAFTADFIFPAAANASYFDILQSLQGTIPAELSTISILGYNDTVGEAQILSNWVYLGPEDEGRELIAPLLDLNPSSTSISVVPYNRLIDTALGGLGVSICSSTYVAGYGVNYRELSSDTYQEVFQMMSDFYIQYPDGRASSVEMELFAPQAVAALANDATAYPWRDTLGYSGISFAWSTTETQQAGEAMGEAVRAAFASTSGYDGLATYVSYAHGDETLTEMFGSNVPRLRRLKQRWDPDNVFRFYHDLAQTPI
ncbi:FAD-binding domain-containing protein [Aspergillus cavernicola]|uniref:FAD-binding domain-containing protein n=1 Tax=Aspergillus cavernicola TaxID=176166 RepID=A0ABR4I8X8_9EURO